MPETFSFFADLSIVIAVAAGVGVLFSRFNLPLTVGYILSGIIVGPHFGPTLIQNSASIQMLSDFGVMFLMFSIGLGFSFRRVRPSLKQAELPTSLKTTDFSVFEGCSALTSVRIPASMTSMNDLLFAECTALSRVDFTGSMNRWKNLTRDVNFGTLEQPYSDFTVYCTDGELTESMS